MLADIVVKGSTDRSVTVAIIDSGDGTPETGVVFNTSGIALWYRREGEAVTAITEATLAALTTAHADGGFLHISDGIYRLDLPDGAFATGAQYVDFGGTVTGMIVIGGRVRLVDTNIEIANTPANVTQFGGSAGTFSGGRPEVNTSHAAGTAWGSGAITNAAFAADAITAAKLHSDVTTELQSGLATSAALAVVDAIVDTMVAGIITGTAASGTLSTTQASSNLSGYTNDQLIGRVLIWLTGNCDGEATEITDYAATGGIMTFIALTTAPSNGDTFKIV